jgi:hypothetical protein
MAARRPPDEYRATPLGGSFSDGNMGIKLANLAQELAALEAQSPTSTLMIFEPGPEHEPFFGDLCRLYLAASELERHRIRFLVADKEGILNCLLGYAYKCARQLQATRDEYWLQLGLAASILAKQKMDYRDVLLAWAELYVVAEEAGIDPNPAFKAIASLARFGSYAVVASRRSGTHRVTPPKSNPSATENGKS